MSLSSLTRLSALKIELLRDQSVPRLTSDDIAVESAMSSEVNLKADLQARSAFMVTTLLQQDCSYQQTHFDGPATKPSYVQ